MSADPLVAMARARIMALSRNLINALKDKNGGGVAIEMLRRLQDRSAESLAALATVDAQDTKAILTLQNEVKRYDEWVAWMQDIIAEGTSYDREETEEDREEMVDILMQTPEGYRQAVEAGLINEDQYSE